MSVEGWSGEVWDAALSQSRATLRLLGMEALSLELDGCTLTVRGKMPTWAASLPLDVDLAEVRRRFIAEFLEENLPTVDAAEVAKSLPLPEECNPMTEMPISGVSGVKAHLRSGPECHYEVDLSHGVPKLLAVRGSTVAIVDAPALVRRAEVVGFFAKSGLGPDVAVASALAGTDEGGFVVRLGDAHMAYQATGESVLLIMGSVADPADVVGDDAEYFSIDDVGDYAGALGLLAPVDLKVGEPRAGRVAEAIVRSMGGEDAVEELAKIGFAIVRSGDVAAYVSNLGSTLHVTAFSGDAAEYLLYASGKLPPAAVEAGAAAIPAHPAGPAREILLLFDLMRGRVYSAIPRTGGFSDLSVTYFESLEDATRLLTIEKVDGIAFSTMFTPDVTLGVPLAGRDVVRVSVGDLTLAVGTFDEGAIACASKPDFSAGYASDALVGAGETVDEALAELLRVSGNLARWQELGEAVTAALAAGPRVRRRP